MGVLIHTLLGQVLDYEHGFSIVHREEHSVHDTEPFRGRVVVL